MLSHSTVPGIQWLMASRRHFTGIQIFNENPSTFSGRFSIQTTHIAVMHIINLQHCWLLNKLHRRDCVLNIVYLSWDCSQMKISRQNRILSFDPFGWPLVCIRIFILSALLCQHSTSINQEKKERKQMKRPNPLDHCTAWKSKLSFHSIFGQDQKAIQLD